MSLQFSSSILLVFFSAVALIISVVVAEVGYISIDGKSLKYWYSKPFEQVCRLDYDHELVKHSPEPLECEKGKTVKREWKLPGDSYKFVNVQGSKCFIGVLREDIFCATVSTLPWPLPGFRKIEIQNENQCQRRNYRYYLPRISCDSNVQNRTGEESCEESCMHSNQDSRQRDSHHSAVDVTRVRAVFSVCYNGRLSETYQFANIPSGEERVQHIRGNYYPFCRAELTPCAKCFRWSNWTTITSCSNTCGRFGLTQLHRLCQIRVVKTNDYKIVSVAYCKAHLGGKASKTEICGSDQPCPKWSQWSLWSGCVTPTTEATSTTKDIRRKKCRPVRASDRSHAKSNFNSIKKNGFIHENNPLLDDVIVTTNKTTVSDVIHTPIGDSSERIGIGNAERRTRVCLYSVNGRGCPGNLTEYRKCPLVDDSNEKAVVTVGSRESTSDEDEGVECVDEDRTTVTDDTKDDDGTEETSTKQSDVVPTSHPGATVHGSHVGKQFTAPIVTTLSTLTSAVFFQNVSSTKRKNLKIIPTDDYGFKTILNNNAPLLIGGLLLLILLLLFTLIAVCAMRICMQKRKARYGVTSPSFSAGTMGSIPSGLHHGFPHPLGLRSGSGTFGRSGSTINGVGLVSDAVSSRGSCRSMTSAVSGNGYKMKNMQNIRTHGLGTSNNVGNAYHVKASVNLQHHLTLAPTQSGLSRPRNLRMSRSKASLDSDRKPSTSSLLSTSSAVCPSPSGMHPCSFQPLPPIPRDAITNRVGVKEDEWVFKRGAGRSSSLTPAENEGRCSHTKAQIRSESVGGRVTGRSYGFTKNDKHSCSVLCRNVNGHLCKRSANKHEINCSHEHDESFSEAFPEHGKNCLKHPLPHDKDPDDVSSPENEYWSVTRSCMNKDSVCYHCRKSSRSKTLDGGRSRCHRSKNLPGIHRRMVNNILYTSATEEVSLKSVQKIENEDSCQHQVINSSIDVSSSGDGSVRSHLGSCGEGTDRGRQRRLISSRTDTNESFYNKIEFERSSDADTVDNDDYDHLCDQFIVGHPSKPKLQRKEILLDHGDDYVAHDYECIELEDSNLVEVNHDFESEGKYEYSACVTDTDMLETNLKRIQPQNTLKNSDNLFQINEGSRHNDAISDVSNSDSNPCISSCEVLAKSNDTPGHSFFS